MENRETAPRVAVVEDEPDIRELVAFHLAAAGFAVKAYGEPREFLDSLEESPPDLVVLDLMLPGLDGLEVCKLLRSREEYAGVAVIILSARGEECDRVIGLELGADDYLPKPFSVRELTARARAVLRRRRRPGGRVIRVGDRLILDLDRHRVEAGGRSVELTPTEFRILRLLASRPGQVFSRETILDRLWGTEKSVLDRTVDVHIKNLRAKLGPAGKLISGLRGVGYRLSPGEG